MVQIDKLLYEKLNPGKAKKIIEELPQQKIEIKANQGNNGGVTAVAALISVLMFMSSLFFCVYMYHMWKKNTIPSHIFDDANMDKSSFGTLDDHKFNQTDKMNKMNKADSDGQYPNEPSELASNQGNLTKMDDSLRNSKHSTSKKSGGNISISEPGVLDMNTMAAMMRQIHVLS